MRRGSCNEKSVYNTSAFKSVIKNALPDGHYIIGDAGYQLATNLLIPYEINDNMMPGEVRYNYLHSKTRIVVEGAFGSLKNRFRILKCPLPHEPKKAAKIIQCCLTLHNILIDLNDAVVIDSSFNSNDDVDVILKRDLLELINFYEEQSNTIQRLL